MFGLGPLELVMASMAMFLWIIPLALVIACIVFFMKRLNQISNDVSRISRSIQNIEAKITGNG